MNAALELPADVGAALLASAEGYTPRATQLIEKARERLGTIEEVAHALAENLPAPKVHPGRSRRRRRRKKGKQQAHAQGANATQDGKPAGTPAAAANGKPKRRRRKPRPPAAKESAGPPQTAEL